MQRFRESGFVASVILATSFILSACGGGGGDGRDPVSEVMISGSVGDGPVTGATVTIYSAAGDLLTSEISDGNASYRSSLMVSSTEYPLIMEVTGGVDMVTGRAPDFQMLSVSVQPSDDVVNINPMSTLIVKTAQAMPGGLTRANIDLATNKISEKLGFGLDSMLIADPITTRVTEANVSNMVKASEALGELVRRTRDLISAAGIAVSGDDVVDAIAADMTDGFMDGLGSAGVDITISAVANVVSGQVLVESLTNMLKVEGVVATAVLDSVIVSIRPGVSPAQLSGAVRITAEMLEQTKVALAAAQVLDSSDGLLDLASSVSTLNAGDLPEDAAGVLATNASDILNTALALAPLTDAVTLVAINSAGYSSDMGSGSPGTVVRTGSATLKWNAPAMRADYTPLSLGEIDGYRLYYGTVPAEYTSVVDVKDGAQLQLTLNGLPVGTYYFVVTAYDVAGRESAYSKMLSRSVE